MLVDDDKQVNDKLVLEVKNPFSGKVIGKVPSMTKEEALQMISVTKKGFQVSKKLSAHQRASILFKAAELIKKEKEALAHLIVTEGIKTIREAKKEVDRCINTIRISAEEATRIFGETIPFDSALGSENRKGYYYRFPMGVIAAITPFNDPLNLIAHKVGPAIASGNAIIVKPSDFTPLCAVRLKEIMHEAGLPANIYNVITGPAENFDNTLISDKRIRMISFTGGITSAQDILKNTGLKKVSMELGANSPVIVLADANIENAVDSCVSGAFWAAGQNCVGVKRIFIHHQIFDQFIKQFVVKTKRLKLGSPFKESTDIGPVINEQAAQKIDHWIKEAVVSGAEILTGGKRKGTLYEPTVLKVKKLSSHTNEQEVFGPVVILSVIDSLEEAISYANNSPYGLHSAIFTNNLKHAFHAIDRLECGGVLVNDSTDYRIDSMPFGGIKNSGLGREGVRNTILEMTETKVVCFNL